jgi:hypothetical protein
MERALIMKKLLIFMVCFAFLASPGYAKQKKKEQKGSGAAVEQVTPEKAEKDLSVGEKRIIEEFYRKQKARDVKEGKKDKNLPKGLQKKMAKGGKMPPGWEKKVAKGRPLDRDVLENSVPLPPELVKELPKQPEETTIVKVEDKIIRILNATKEVLDVFDITF